MDEEELPLSGGNVSTVVRVGNTVRRTLGPWSPAVHELLRHLESKGFSEAPRFLGIDERGREVLTFIEGEIGNYPLKAYMWSDEVLKEVARLLRRFHDATVDFVPSPGATWQFEYPDAAQHEVICHNDVAPYNMVYVDGRPEALIDFDTAGPGPRLWDVTHAAYRFVPLLHIDNEEMQSSGTDQPDNSKADASSSSAPPTASRTHAPCWICLSRACRPCVQPSLNQPHPVTPHFNVCLPRDTSNTTNERSRLYTVIVTLWSVCSR